MEDDFLEITGTRLEKLKGGRSGMLSYARKYAAKTVEGSEKGIQKEVPEDYRSVGRFWGLRGCRLRATCHVTYAGVEGGGRLLGDVTAVCEKAVQEGLLRRWPWERGEGFIYFPAARNATLYTIGVGQEVDMVLMRHATRWGGFDGGM